MSSPLPNLQKYKPSAPFSLFSRKYKLSFGNLRFLASLRKYKLSFGNLRFLASLRKSLPFALVFAGSLMAVLSALSALLITFPSLPPEIPLLFTAGKALTAKPLLFLIPFLALLFFAINIYFTDRLLGKNEEAAAILPTFLTAFVSLLLSSALFRIVKLFPTALLPFEKVIYPLLLPFLFATLLSLFLTFLTEWILTRLHLFDKPHGPYPQVRPIPRLGALPLYLTFAIVALALLPLDECLLALLFGGAIITLIQSVDDLRPLPFWIQGTGHLLAALVIIVGGVGIEYVRNPLFPWIGEKLIYLNRWQIPFIWQGITYQLTVWADLFTIIWIFALVNIVDWLDGLDGLAGGVGIITGAAIIAISIIFNTPMTAFLGVILVGALVGFLPLNFFPAKIYLGGGAFLLGYFLAVLSIFSGAKTGTAFLVLALPAIDAFYVIYRRVRERRSPFRGDTTHLHHRLLEKGFSQPQIIFLEWGIIALLAVAAILLEGFYKLLGILAVFIGALLANRWLLRRSGSVSPKKRKV